MNMKKVLGVVMAAAVAVALTGCSGFDAEPATQAAATASQADNAGSGDASAKGVIYGIYKAGDQTWFIDEGEAAKKVVEQRGDEFIYVDAKMNPEEYLKAIDNAVANQAKGIVTCIPDQTMSQVVVDKCKEAGIPVVACDDALQNDAGDKLAPWVGINAYVIGQANGDWQLMQKIITWWRMNSAAFCF